MPMLQLDNQGRVGADWRAVDGAVRGANPQRRPYRWTSWMAPWLAGAAVAMMGGCASGAKPSSGPQYAGAPGGSPGMASVQGGPAGGEAYRSASPRMRSAGMFKLPGFQQRQLVKYEVVDGMAVMEGDILLGPVSALALRYGLALSPISPNVMGAVATTNTAYLWPGAVIPYEIDGSNSSSTVQKIQWALAEVSKTRLSFRPRTGADHDYVVFRDTGSGCNSYVGRIGGPQVLSTSGCAAGSIAHELLHSAGFYHEHSRSDRDNFVTIMWDEIDPGEKDNFEKRTSISVDMGAYDYSSIMHYHGMAFSKSGRPTIVPKSPNANIGQRDGLSPLDQTAVNQLYGGGATPAPGPTQPPPGQPPPPQQPENGSFSGNYVSQQGNVSCSQNGAAVQCSYPAGTLWCTAAGADLSCGWTGSAGQGRAVFRRQPNGAVAGTWGDAFSADSRGAWDWTPDGTAPAQPAQPAPAAPFPLPWAPGTPPPTLPFPFPSSFPPWPQ